MAELIEAVPADDGAHDAHVEFHLAAEAALAR